MKLKPLYNLTLDNIYEEDFSNFKDIVTADIKTQSSEEVIAYLHQHLDLWHYTLQILRKDIELQLSCQNLKVEIYKNNLKIDNYKYSKEEIIEYINKQHSWRMTAVKFLSNIERKTLYVKMLLKNK